MLFPQFLQINENNTYELKFQRLNWWHRRNNIFYLFCSLDPNFLRNIFLAVGIIYYQELVYTFNQDNKYE